ncbi:MAG TPA: phosphopantetheine-binding protein [Syntrophomonas sp.]|nr:phosphopantetheine-binding protein [Syntrophomonas sp.]
MNEIEQLILKFFEEKGKADGLTEDTDLFKGGYVNSLFALEMVMYLEDTFQIKIKNKDINEKNFKTIRSIAEVVQKSNKK